LASPGLLYVILDKEVAGKKDLAELARMLIKAGVDYLQLRDKVSSDREILALAKKIKGLCPRRVKFILNDRPDLALLSGADGIHLGQQDVCPKAARHLLGKKKIIGLSCASRKELLEARRQPIDYFALGPIFKTSTKKDLPPIGLSLIKVAASFAQPFFVIGGIKRQNLPLVLSAGAKNVCLASAVLKAKYPAQEVQKIKTLIG
jgi:thiamine-phosphate pyrophosphorylase